MLRLRLDEDAAIAKSRFSLVALLSLNLRLMDNWRQLQQRGWGQAVDAESTLILVAIELIRAEGVLTGGLNGRYHSLESPIPPDRLRRCNLSSIAATTALNRETVRRKVKKLENLGFVTREEDGCVRLLPGVLQMPEVRDALISQLHLFARTGNELARQGIIKLIRS